MTSASDSSSFPLLLPVSTPGRPPSPSRDRPGRPHHHASRPPARSIRQHIRRAAFQALKWDPSPGALAVTFFAGLILLALSAHALFPAFRPGSYAPSHLSSWRPPTRWTPSDLYPSNPGPSPSLWECEKAWRDQPLGHPSAVPPDAGGGGGLAGHEHDAQESGERGYFSLEDEIRQGKTRKEALSKMLKGTKGYYARDWPKWLGWNNMRYIIEASALHAQLLNRTLVIPTYLYARSCEFELSTCEAFATMVNRGDAMSTDEWRKEPFEKQMGWMIPIELMLDVSLLRRVHPIMTIADYLLLHDLPADLENKRGDWDRTGYHPGGSSTLYVIGNANYDNDIVRVDRMPESFPNIEWSALDTGLGKMIRDGLDWTDRIRNWDEVVRAARDTGLDIPDALLEGELARVGVYPLRTWQGSVGMDFVRTVVEPVKQAALAEKMHGFWDDFHHVNAEVLLLEGETHPGRKPGALRFTSQQPADDFAQLTIFNVHPPQMILTLSARLDQRMRGKVGGRMWASAHMRRGDFVTAGWVMENDGYSHFERIQDRITKGQELVRSIKQSGVVERYPVPGVTLTEDYALYEAPIVGDSFFIATDERNATLIEHMKKNGAILIGDLLTAEDRRDLAAWPLIFSDVLGLLEQTLLARSAYFYGHAMSSVSGGAQNYRALFGKDPRTTLID